MAFGVGTKLDTLFYDLEVRGRDAAKELSVVEEAGRRFAATMKAHPIAMTATLSASLVVVGLRAAQMAEEVNKGIRSTVQTMPQLRARLGDLRRGVEEISLTTGKSQQDISGLFASAAKTGVSSYTELRRVVEASMALARATGEDANALIGALDQTLDGFGISALRAQEIAAQLFAITQGRIGIVELTDAFKPLIPTLNNVGVSFETAAAALTSLVGDKGLSARAAAAEIKALADQGASGAEKIRALGSATLTAAEAQAKLQEALDHGVGSMEKAQDVLKQQLNAELIRLGNLVLPGVVKGLNGLAAAVLTFRQTIGSAPLVRASDIDLPAVTADAKESLARTENWIKTREADKQRLEADRARLLKELDELNKHRGALVKSGTDVGAQESGLNSDLQETQDRIDALTLRLKDAKEQRDALLNPPKQSTFSSGAGLDPDAARRAEDLADKLGALKDRADEAVVALGDDYAGAVAKLSNELNRAVGEIERTKGVTAAQAEEAKRAAATILDAFKAQQGRDLAKVGVDSIRQIQEATDALAVSELRRQGRNREADALELQQRQAAAEATLRQAEAEGQLEDGAAEDIINAQRRKTAIDQQIVQTATQTALAEELGDLRATNAAAELEAIGKINEARLVLLDYDAKLLEAEQASLRARKDTSQGEEERAARLAVIEEKLRALAIARGVIVQGGLSQQVTLQREIASETIRTAMAAADLLVSLGAVPGEMADALKSALSMADAITEAKDALKALNTGKGSPLDVLSGVAGVIGAAGGLADALSGFFGDSPSPAQQEQSQRTREATEATRRLTDAITAYTDITLSGQTFSRLQSGLSSESIARDLLPEIRRAFKITDPSGTFGAGGSLDKAVLDYLKDLGVTLEDVRKAAQEAGVPLRKGIPTFEDLENIGKALEAQEFNKFANSFAGTMDSLQIKFQLFGTGPVDQFKETIDALTGPKGAPKLFEMLKGIDISTVEGAAQASQLIQQLFADFESIDPALFGKLNPQEFLGVLTGLMGLLPAFPGPVEEMTAAFADLQEGFRVFEVDGTREIDAFLATLGKFVPEVAGLLEGVDLGSADGLAAAKAALVQLYKDVKAGTIELADGAMHFLLQAIDLLIGSAPDAAAALQTLGERMASLADDMDALGITDPLEQLKYTMARLGETAPEIAEALKGLDLTTAEGLKQAEEALAALFFAAKNGTIDLAAEDLLRFQDLIRDAMAKIVDDAKRLQEELDRQVEETNREAQRAAEEAQRAAEAAADAARSAAEQAERNRVATGARATQQLQDELGLFDITDPIEKLRQQVELLKEGSGGLFSQLLGGLDLANAADRNSALTKLQEFFLANPQGQDAGFFSADMVRQQTLAIAEAIKTANAADITGGQNQSFQVNQQITSTQGSQVIGLLASQLQVLQAILSATTGGIPLTPVQPPPIQPQLFTGFAAVAGGPGPESGTTLIGPITINFTADGVSGNVPISGPAGLEMRAFLEALVRELQIKQAGG